VSYPNLAKFREHLERWFDEYLTDQERVARANRKRLPEPARDPEADARVAKGMRDLAEHLRRGFSPSIAVADEATGELIAPQSEDAA
jgi:hypothetical protein